MRLHARHALGLLLLPLACSSVVRQPEVRIEDVSVGGIGLRGGTLYAHVHITNPNGFAIETESLTYDLQVPDPNDAGEWVSFSQDTLTERIRVDENSSTVVQVPVQFRYEDMGGALRAIMDTGTFNYRVSGEVRLSEPIGRTIPYAKSGVVSLDGIR